MNPVKQLLLPDVRDQEPNKKTKEVHQPGCSTDGKKTPVSRYLGGWYDVNAKLDTEVAKHKAARVGRGLSRPGKYWVPIRWLRGKQAPGPTARAVALFAEVLAAAAAMAALWEAMAPAAVEVAALAVVPAVAPAQDSPAIPRNWTNACNGHGF